MNGHRKVFGYAFVIAIVGGLAVWWARFASVVELGPEKQVSCGGLSPVVSFAYVQRSGLWLGEWLGRVRSEQDVCSKALRLSSALRRYPDSCLQKTVKQIILAGDLHNSSRSKQYLGFCKDRAKVIVIQSDGSPWFSKNLLFHELAHLVLNSGYMEPSAKAEWRRLALSPASFVSGKASESIDEDMAETLAFVLDSRATVVPDNEVLSRKIALSTVVLRSWCPNMERGE